MKSGGDKRQDERDTRDAAMLRATRAGMPRSAAQRDTRPPRRPERKGRE